MKNGRFIVEEQTLPFGDSARGVDEVESQSMYEHLLRRREAQRINKAREDGNAHELPLERVQRARGNVRREARLRPVDLIPHYLGRIDQVCAYYRGLHWSDEKLKN